MTDVAQSARTKLPHTSRFEIFKSLAPLLISVASLAMAAMAFYETRFSKADLEVLAGPTIRLYHPRPDVTGIYLPATFLNRSKRTDTVSRVSLIVRRHGDGVGHSLDWFAFAGYDALNEQFTVSELAHALPLEPGGSDGRMLRFTWRGGGTALVFAAGSYDVALVAWRPGANKPAAISRHVMQISSEDASLLEATRLTRQPRIVSLPLDGAVPDNGLIMSLYIDKLLGDNRQAPRLPE